MRTAITATAALLLSLTVGCAQPSEEDVGGAAAAVVKGTKTDDSPAVGYLMTVIGKTAFGADCTATLVAPNLVLTAAHCLEGADNLHYLKAGYLRFGVGRVDENRTVRIASFTLHPSFAKFDAKAASPGRHDFAYVVLATPIRDVKPMTVRRTAHRGGCVYDSLGYGISTDGYDVRTAKDDAVVESGIRQSLEQCATAKLVDHAIEVSSTKGGTCQGDSGGPLILRGKDEMVGVVSYGVSTKKAAGCGAGKRTYYAAVSENLAFVEKAFAESTRLLEEPSVPPPAPSAPPPQDEPDAGPQTPPSPPSPPADDDTDAGIPAPPAPPAQDETDAGAATAPAPKDSPEPSRSPEPPPQLEVDEFDTKDPAEDARKAARASDSSETPGEAAASCSSAAARTRSTPTAPLVAVLALAGVLLARRRRS